MNLYDDSAEKQVLGALLKDPGTLSEVAEILPDSSYFGNTTGAAAYKAILELDQTNDPFDLYILGDRGISRVFMVDCMEEVVFPEHATKYAETVKNYGLRRRLRDVIKRIDSDIENPQKSLSGLLSQSESELTNLTNKTVQDSPKEAKSAMLGVMEAVNRYDRGEKPPGLVPTGIDILDSKVEMAPGNMVVVAGWTSQGKTQLALQVAQYNAIHRSLPVLVFSLEMNAEDLGFRLLCNEANMDNEAIKRGRLSAIDRDIIERASRRISDAPLHIYDNPAVTITEIRAIAKRYRAKHGIGLVVIDYLQLVTPQEGDTRQEQVASISRGGKLLAGEIKVPVIALSQLTDLPATQARRAPRLGDMRESKAIAHDADSVLFVYHPNPMEGKIIVGKQRNGGLGTIMMSFQKGKWNEVTRKTEH